MPSGKHKSRTYRRKKIRVAQGTRLHYLKRKPKKNHCAECQRPLPGVPKLRPYQLRKLSKTSRRPQRPYGGVLCSPCMRDKIKMLQ